MKFIGFICHKKCINTAAAIIQMKAHLFSKSVRLSRDETKPQNSGKWSKSASKLSTNKTETCSQVLKKQNDTSIHGAGWKKIRPPTKIICEMFLKRKEQEEAFSRGIKTSPHLFSVLWTQAHEWRSPVATPSVFQPVAQIIHEIHEAHDYQWHYKTPLALVCWSSAEKTAVAPFSDQPGSRLLSDLLTLYRSLHAKQELALFIFLPTRSHYALPFLLKSVIHKMDQVGIWDVQPCSCFSNMFDVQ